MNRRQLTEHLRISADRSLRGIRLRGMNLTGLDFSGIDMTGADLSFSNLRRTVFDRTILQSANLSFSNLGRSSFVDTDLRGADLSFSGLAGVDLSRAKIEGASLSFTNVSSRAFQPVKPRHDRLTLISLLNTPGWGVLIGMVLSALLVYGVSGIIYFTYLILTAKNPLIGRLNLFIAWQNINQGVALFLMAWWLSSWLDRRIRPVWLRHLAFTGLMLPVLAMVGMATYLWLGQSAFAELERLPVSVGSEVIGNSVPGWLYFMAYLLIGNLFLYALRQGRQLTRRMGEQEFQLMSLEKLKTRAELDALQAKINPHFLYNALNSIASLVHEDPNKAEEMTMLLSKLFRYTTGRDGGLFTTLADELEMVETYLRVEQVRFGERLRFRVEMTDPALGALRLPQFLLQPIVENAVKHGMAKLADNGLIEVMIYEKDNDLTICIHDNGPAFADTLNAGYGLRSIQEKLRLLYGDDARLTIENEPKKQVLIQIATARLTETTRYEPTLANVTD
jgi:two-component system, LytTR family, sensor kinase